MREASSASKVCDIAVIGGGILGLAVTALAARAGYRALVLRLNDSGRPRADTLRNQGWLQSGLMYVDKFKDDRKRGRRLAAQMYAAGLAMLTSLGLPHPGEDDHAVIRLRNEEEGLNLEADAESLRIDGVKQLDSRSAKQGLGDIYEDGIFYSLPDAPFPEAVVLTKLRDASYRFGADVIQVSAPAQLVRDSGSESGVRIDLAGLQIYSKATIAAAGAGNSQLLGNLEIATATKLRQTPLLVLHESFATQAPIFADRVRGFSFVRHPAEERSLPNGALVIGTRVDREVEFRLPDYRKIERDDLDRFAEYLPPLLRDRMRYGRFTAGYEVIPDKRLERKDVEPWIEWVDGFPALLQAMPGRATMGMFVAQQVMDAVTARIGDPDLSRTSSNTVKVGWKDPIWMHYDATYDFDDSK